MQIDTERVAGGRRWGRHGSLRGDVVRIGTGPAGVLVAPPAQAGPPSIGTTQRVGVVVASPAQAGPPSIGTTQRVGVVVASPPRTGPARVGVLVMTVAALAVLAIGTYLMRLLPVVLHSRMNLSARAVRLVELGAVALLVALTATGTWFEGDEFAGWARPAAVLVAGIAAWRRLPFILVVLLAAGTAAGLRLLGVP